MISSFGHLAVTFATENVPSLKVPAKCPMDPNIQKLSSGHPCGHSDIYLPHRAHTGQALEQFEVFHIWYTLKSENLRFDPSDRPTPQIVPKYYEQEALCVGIKVN